MGSQFSVFKGKLGSTKVEAFSQHFLHSISWEFRSSALWGYLVFTKTRIKLSCCCASGELFEELTLPASRKCINMKSSSKLFCTHRKKKNKQLLKIKSKNAQSFMLLFLHRRILCLLIGSVAIVEGRKNHPPAMGYL
jgi:hypothetical protein